MTASHARRTNRSITPLVTLVTQLATPAPARTLGDQGPTGPIAQISDHEISRLAATPVIRDTDHPKHRALITRVAVQRPLPYSDRSARHPNNTATKSGAPLLPLLFVPARRHALTLPALAASAAAHPSQQRQLGSDPGALARSA